MPDRWSQVEDLFHRALERSESERSAFLDEACAGDEALRREVESLLAEESESAFMETPAMEGEARELAQENGPTMEGRRIGAFEILSLLGKGGMGEVWRARDTKLRREVAIKTLPEEFAQDEERLARFEREATLLASLNHPNIAAIYGLEEENGTRFLVLELVEGDTLADRLKRGAIPVEESLKLALQTAEALEAAHEKGVIHRDLKPGNVKVTPDGNVKVLDFGLAKAVSGKSRGADLSTQTVLRTREGVIQGTPVYMSPQHVRGEVVDKRTDIWAFGCVLYEMLTGRRSFSGETLSDIVAKILESEPNWNSLPANIHPKIRELLERCLDREVKTRWHDIADARVDIQKVLADPQGVIVRPAVAAPAAARSVMPLIGTAVAGAVLAVAATLILQQEPASPPVVRFSHSLSEGLAFDAAGRILIDVSPDGSTIVYVDNGELWLRNISSENAHPVLGTQEGPQISMFSPDGQSIAYWANNQLKTIQVTGGAPMPLCDASLPTGLDWTNQTIYFGQGLTIMAVSSNGGTPELIVQDGLDPLMLPGDKVLIFNRESTEAPSGRQIWAQELETGKQTLLVEDGRARGYAPTGHLIYNNLASTMLAVPFDAQNLEVSGGSVPVIENVGQHFDLSENGTAVYLPRAAQPKDLVWVDREGREETLTAEPGDYNFPVLSPDGSMVSYVSGDDVWTHDIEAGVPRQETFSAGLDGLPHWNPDGDLLSFSSGMTEARDIFVKRVDPRGEPVRLLDRARPQFATSWSPDGRWLAFHEYEQGTSGLQDIFTLSLDDGEVSGFASTGADERGAMFSPNGEWIAYVSDEQGDTEVYVMPFPADPGQKVRVSYGGGSAPLWGVEGDELFYRDRTSVVRVEIGQDGMPGRSQGLFPDIYRRIGNGNVTDYDIDGSRFLMVKNSQTAAPRQIHVILNWFEELKERVPVP